MLRIKLPATEVYDENKNEFVYLNEQILQFEHSLVSLSKWESKWNKAFLTKTAKTDEELLDYIKCMTITQNVSDDVYDRLTPTHIRQIEKYIKAPMTATTFSKDDSSKKSHETVTSELIYYWMVTFNIPFECQKWHLNRLMTLIRVCTVKNAPRKKRSQSDILRSRAELNAARRKQLGSKG